MLKILGGVLATVGLFGALAGCAADAASSESGNGDIARDVKTEKVSPTGTDTTEVTATFLTTCNGATYNRDPSTGHIYYAAAETCRRRNGTWTGARSWSGDCWGDVSNDDGNIVCYN